MILIYWNWKVGQGIADLCDHLAIPYDIMDYHSPLPPHDKYEFIIPSPGVPSHHGVYKTWKVMSELDFAYQYLPKLYQIIAITGTDGKSTTSWIMYNILQKEYFGKKSVYLSWNFDIPFSATLLEILKKWEKKGIIVVEISSFMAYSLRIFQPDYSIFTNFKPDHLNWHKNLQDYLDAKMNLLSQTKKTSVINEQVLRYAKDNNLSFYLPSNFRSFEDQSLWKWNSLYKDRTDGENIILSWRKKYLLSETQFSWIHNAMNILSVSIVANEMRICSKRIKLYLAEIQGLSHRLEKIGEKDGCIFVEDSKSTSSQSLEAALWSYGNTKNLLLIVGWSDKGDVFEYLWDKFSIRVKAVVCIGATKDHFIRIAKERNIPYISTDNLQKWVEWLYKQKEWGDIIMLSPWCASFGLFHDYLDRANQFRAIIKKLSV